MVPRKRIRVKKVLFVAGDRRELAGVLRHTEELRVLKWPVDFACEGRLGFIHAVYVANGPGPELARDAAAAATARLDFDAIVSTGYCGALDPSLRLYDILAATEIVDETGAAYACCVPPGVKSGRLLSIPRVAQSADEKRELSARAAAVDMEAVSVARCAGSKPVYALRVVSDTASEGFELDLNALRSSDGRWRAHRMIRAALKQPATGVPALLRLHKRSRIAAERLGGFLASCSF
jgi:adenosylhomocysteine nucleosidase